MYYLVINQLTPKGFVMKIFSIIFLLLLIRFPNSNLATTYNVSS